MPTDAKQIPHGVDDPVKWDDPTQNAGGQLDELASRLKWTVTAIKTANYTASDRELVRVDPS